MTEPYTPPKPMPERDATSGNRGTTAASGTLTADPAEVKVVPPGWIRERVHIGDGHYKWSEPFDPVARAKEEADEYALKLEQSGEAAKAKEREAALKKKS